mgnify:CR=1 FL=1
MIMNFSSGASYWRWQLARTEARIRDLDEMAAGIEDEAERAELDAEMARLEGLATSIETIAL